MAAFDSIAIFIVGLLIGGGGIYVAGRVLTDKDDLGYALVTAILGSVAWSLMAILVSSFPWLSGFAPIAALIAWIGVIKWRYSGGWIAAAFIGFVAWIVVFAFLYALASIGVVGFDAVGVPGL